MSDVTIDNLPDEVQDGTERLFHEYVDESREHGTPVHVDADRPFELLHQFGSDVHLDVIDADDYWVHDRDPDEGYSFGAAVYERIEGGRDLQFGIQSVAATTVAHAIQNELQNIGLR